ALELVPPAALERVEIFRGSAAALAGGGSEAGVIQLFTRRGGPASGRLEVAAGDFGTRDAGGRFGGRLGGLDLFASGSYHETDGFRDNAAGELGRLSLGGGWELAEDRRLELSWLGSSGDFGNPGALTLEELAADPERSPFNSLDFSDRELSQATASYSDLLGEAWALRANLFARDADTRILTTGRAAPVFGGFHSGTDASVAGSAVQLTWEDGGGSSRRFDLGVEWLDGDTDAVGIPTPPGDPGQVDPAAVSSDNTADRETLALFAQAGWRPAAAWSLTAGARWDDDEIGYRERLPDPANVATRGFSELSLRAGATWSAAAGHDLYASLSDGFLPPTPEDLFSFPGFGSNPELEPEDSRSLEVGYRGSWSRGRSLAAALFQADTEDEIVFDPDSPRGLFGANVNQGEARRRGLELSLRGPLGDRLRGFANLTLMDTELRSGANAGAELPLVPDERLALGLDADLPAGLGLRLTALHVGEQVLDNDEANAVERLDAYQVVDLRLSWRSGLGGGDGLELFVEARNLFDESYASRGIFAFDFSTFT
ncbi:MAG: TonB-dependent receptor, partial [Thermoanaerobaculia bacterium]|nr:TonB-dependent receptor [Thermoanaerobaculia bacterium]